MHQYCMIYALIGTSVSSIQKYVIKYRLKSNLFLNIRIHHVQCLIWA